MKIISWNVNGLRAVYKRGFLDWLKESDADIVCLQETKAQRRKLTSDLVKPENYHSFFNSAKKRNLGWRIDYTFVSRKLATKLKDTFIFPNVPGSDHCPIGIEI